MSLAYRAVLVAFGVAFLVCMSSCAEQKPSESKSSVSATREESEPKDPSPQAGVSAKLIPPITIADAAEFADGGTTYVHLKDANGRELLICVSEPVFAETIPVNTLFLDASHPEAPEARLPHSEEEVALVIDTLGSAIEREFPESERKNIGRWGDPLEHFWHEKYTMPEAKQRSRNEWVKIFAWDAYRRLKSKSKFATLDSSHSTKPGWYDSYSTDREKKIAEEQRIADQDARFKEAYPLAVRNLLKLPDGTDEVQFEPPGAASTLDDDPIQKQGKLVAEAIGDPVLLSEISCRALGTLSESWTYSTTRDRIAIQAMLTATPEEFATALPRIASDERALLGAGRIFYHLRYGNNLPTSAWAKWAPPITKALLNRGADKNKSMIIAMLARTKNPKATSLLRSIARGEFGIEPDLSEQWDEEPGISTSAYLGLALRNDVSVREEIIEAMTKAEPKQNIAALEVSLALLGDPSYLTKQNMELDSYSIGLALIRAIERFEGKHGMDLLMSSGLDHDYAAIANESLLAAQRISGEQWIPEGSRFQPVKYADDARSWWDQNRDRF